MPLLPPAGIGDFRVKRTQLPISASVAPAVSQSATRVYIGFSAPAGTAYIDTDPGLTASHGIALQNTFLPYEVFWGTHGALVNQAWYYVAAASVITVYEVFYEPKSSPLMERANGNPAQTTQPSASAHGKS